MILFARILCRLGFHREYLEEAFGTDPKDDVIYVVICGRCEHRRLSINGARPKIPHPNHPRGNLIAAREWLAAREGSVGRYARIWWA
jgi:hypothetical protein